MNREEPYYIPIPEEYGRRKLNALYREIPLKDTTSRLLRKYFNAAANLYGIIPPVSYTHLTLPTILRV